MTTSSKVVADVDGPVASTGHGCRFPGYRAAVWCFGVAVTSQTADEARGDYIRNVYAPATSPQRIRTSAARTSHTSRALATLHCATYRTSSPARRSATSTSHTWTAVPAPGAPRDRLIRATPPSPIPMSMCVWRRGRAWCLKQRCYASCSNSHKLPSCDGSCALAFPPWPPEKPP